MTTFFFPSGFDLALFDACGLVFLAWLAFAKWNRRRQTQRENDFLTFEEFEEKLREWKTAPPEPLEGPVDLIPLILEGDVLPRRKLVVDELGPWDPAEHRAVDPVLFDAMTWVFPVEQGVDWAPWWRTPTGAWETVAPRQLEASPS